MEIWTLWWLNGLKKCFPTIFGNITLICPASIFQDVTTQINGWNGDIDLYLLARLRDTCNKHLILTVKCPWGCSEFIYKVGYLPLDVVFQRYLQKCIVKMISRNVMDKLLITAREDYIHDENDEDWFYFNSEWKVMPSISFIHEKGYLILTCSEHNNPSCTK